jgi:hypothetical protein
MKLAYVIYTSMTYPEMATPPRTAPGTILESITKISLIKNRLNERVNSLRDLATGTSTTGSSFRCSLAPESTGTCTSTCSNNVLVVSVLDGKCAVTCVSCMVQWWGSKYLYLLLKVQHSVAYTLYVLLVVQVLLLAVLVLCPRGEKQRDLFIFRYRISGQGGLNNHLRVN